MWTLVDTGYVIVAAAMLALSYKNWRGALWIVCLAASYFISGFAWRETGNAALFTLICDTAVFLAVYAIGRHLWEFWLLVVQFAMMLASVAYTAFQPDLEVYQIALEALNAAGLFLIGGTGAWIIAGHTDARAFHHVRHLVGFGFALNRQGHER